MIDEPYDKAIKHCMVTASVNGVMSVWVAPANSGIGGVF